MFQLNINLLEVGERLLVKFSHSVTNGYVVLVDTECRFVVLDIGARYVLIHTDGTDATGRFVAVRDARGGGVSE